MRSTAAEQRTQRFAAFTRQREQEEQERRDRIIAEFDGDPQAMAAERSPALSPRTARHMDPRPQQR
jgi:hypothetical protein